MRAEIEDRASPRGDSQPSPELLARIRLLEDKPEWALRALGGPCAREVPADRLVALGLVNEYADRLAAARVCYEMAAATGGTQGAAALARAATLDARLPDKELRKADRRTLGRGGGRAHRRRRVGAGPARGGRGRSDHRARAHAARAGARRRQHDRRRPVGRGGARRRPASHRQLARGRRRAPQPAAPERTGARRRRLRRGRPLRAPALARPHGRERASPPPRAVSGRRARRRTSFATTCSSIGPACWGCSPTRTPRATRSSGR